MALFQKNPHSSNEQHSLYTVGQSKTVLIVGLGNKGKQYDGTRHNIGFFVLDAFANKLEFEKWQDKKDLKSHLSIKTLGSTRVILCKPMTFMNNSGEAISAVSNFYKIAVQDILVVHDELDLPFGQIRTRQGGSGAGHNGILSAIQHIGEDFGRVRIGVDYPRPTGMSGADFVLAKFSPDEQKHMSELQKEVVSILTEYVYSDSINAETRNFII